jgi:hypothetical protein
MKKKILGGIAILAVAVVALINIELTKKENGQIIFTLTNIEQNAAASNEINYHVPDQSNDPKTCTLEIWIEGSGSVGNEGGSGSGHYKKVSGIKNTCRTGSAGCDPYSCHQNT